MRHRDVALSHIVLLDRMRRAVQCYRCSRVRAPFQSLAIRNNLRVDRDFRIVGKLEGC